MTRSREVVDLSIAGQRSVLDFQVPQFRCGPCGHFFTVEPACLLEGRHVTVRLAEALADCVNVSTLTAASATYGVPESTVKAVFEQVVEGRRERKARTLKPIAKMGVDEIHLEVRGAPCDPAGAAAVPGGSTGNRAADLRGEKSG